MEAEMFGRVLKEHDLQDELDQLDAMILEEAIPSAATNPIEAKPAAAAATRQIQEPVNAKRKLVAA
jgi:hypothetical protein